jgi:hypothetical protein
MEHSPHSDAVGRVAQANDFSSSALSEVQKAIAELEAMPLDALRVAWVRRMKTSPPKLSAGLLRLALAHALQSKLLGGITKTTDRKLWELASSGDNGPPPGTRLTRSWRGTVHTVTVTEDEKFHWQGKDWDSLSVIARTITGTRWSGPAFFGTRQRKAS